MSADQIDDREFSAFEARQLRYAIYWAFYENTAYRDIHKWAQKVRADYGLYKYIRGIHNPTYRLGEFYATHLLGGALDPLAGDGVQAPSALPILTDNEQLRPALAALWRASNWQTNKEIWTRNGAILGDTVLKICDDVRREKIYLRVLHPGVIRELEQDDAGNVKAYLLEEQRDDPRQGRAWKPVQATQEPRQVTYTEIAERDGDDVRYRTFLNGEPYAWDGGDSPEWAEPYGFIPLVVCQHLNVGLDWGWSELHAGHGKMSEVDDQASKLSDQIRKLVDAPWLMSGVPDPNDDVRPRRRSATTTTPRSEAGRQDLPILYAPADATAQALVAPVPIGEVSQRITDLIAELERDYPELQMDIWTASGNASGRALRVARQRVTAKVQMRRAGYDDALARAQQMAVAIGGFRGYAGYDGFDLDSYAAGLLDHRIGARPVFETDPLDKTEEDTAFWEAAIAAKSAGYPLELYLEDNGWSAERIARFNASPERQARTALLEAGLQLGGDTAPPTTDDDDDDAAASDEDPTS